MNKIDALNYLVDNAARSHEWEEAGMAYAYSRVIKSEDEEFSEEFLDSLITQAENN